MAIRSFAGTGSANVAASLAQRNPYDATKYLGLINQGLTNIGQIAPEAELRNLLRSTTQDNYADNIGLISSLAAQSSKPYQEQAVRQLGYLDALTGRGLQRDQLGIMQQQQDLAMDKFGLEQQLHPYAVQQAKENVQKQNIENILKQPAANRLIADAEFGRRSAEAEAMSKGLPSLGITPQPATTIGVQEYIDRPELRQEDLRMFGLEPKVTAASTSDYAKGDVVKTNDGYFRVVYNKKNPTNVQYIPSSENEFNASKGKAGSGLFDRVGQSLTSDEIKSRNLDPTKAWSWDRYGQPKELGTSQEQIKNAARSAVQTSVLKTTAALDGLDRVSDILSKTDFFTSALPGSIASYVSGTDANDIEKIMKTVQSQETFNALSRLKEASASGASGLGQVTEKEIDLLMNELQNFNIGMTKGEQRKSFKGLYDRYKSTMKSLANDKIGREFLSKEQLAKYSDVFSDKIVLKGGVKQQDGNYKMPNGMIFSPQGKHIK